MTPFSDNTLEYFEQYQKKVKEVKSLKERMRNIQTNAQHEIESLYKNMQSLEHDCINMRKIITKVLDDEMDSVEARLKSNNNIEELQNNTVLWNSYHSVGGQFNVNQLLMHTNHLIDNQIEGTNSYIPNSSIKISNGYPIPNVIIHPHHLSCSGPLVK